MNYKWPGNVRELENVIERALVLTEHDTIQVEDLPVSLHSLDVPASTGGQEEFIPESLSIKKNAKKMESKLISIALAKTKGNKTQAAQLLEISLPALLYKMKEYGLTS